MFPVTPNAKNTLSKSRNSLGKVRVSHGCEEEIISKQRHLVVNINMCIEKSTAPKSVATESVLLKYIVDTHMDSVWSHYLADLLTDSCLVANPLPRLVTELRRSAIKMSVMYESEEKLKQRLIHGTARYGIRFFFIQNA